MFVIMIDFSFDLRGGLKQTAHNVEVLHYCKGMVEFLVLN